MNDNNQEFTAASLVCCAGVVSAKRPLAFARLVKHIICERSHKWK